MMEQFYYIGAIVVYGIFIIRFILSWVGGDFDLDMDADGDVDLGDVVSFKGATHFLMGFFGWMSIEYNASHKIEWYDYIIALILGFIFVIILFYIYKFMMKLESKPQILKDNELVGNTCKVYLCMGQKGKYYRYIITVSNGIGTSEYTALSKNCYNIGEVKTILNFKDSNFII